MNTVAGSDSKELKIALLGCVEIRLAGIPINIGYAKLHGLLVVLAVSNSKPLQRDYLAELFWPDMPTDTGRQNLRRALYNLKSALGESSHLLVTNKHSVTLSHQGLWLDVNELTDNKTSSDQIQGASDIVQMEYKVKLYRAEFMMGFSLPGCQDFDDWLQLQRESLHRHMLNLLEHLSNHHKQAGSHSKALKFALRHIELEPWNEAAQRQVMHLYALNGQESEAARQYDVIRTLLKNELDIEPTEETQNLITHIRNGKFSTASTEDVMNGLISELYRSVDQPDQWVDVIGKISSSIGAEKFLFATRDRVTLEIKGQFHWALGDDALDAYLAHYSAVDVLSKSLENAQRDQFHTSQDLYPDREFLATEIYNDFCRPFDIRHSTGVAFDDPDSTLYTQFACLRGAGTSEFLERDIRPWNNMVPHLQQFVRLRQKFEHLQQQEARSTEQILERFSVAAFLCKSNGQIIGRNELAEEMLRTSKIFTAQTETMVFAQQQHQTQFITLVSQANNTVDGVGTLSSGSWRIQDGDSMLVFNFFPFTFRPEGIVDSIQPCALILISNTSRSLHLHQ
ncbi:MAG: hypothetical protein OEL79_02630 [Chromatiales bacterium]|nr:hypothetical protein [Chromatiales bacterium]